MPQRDGTGPNGAGPMTGRGFGPCDNGQGNDGFGRGRGRRRFLSDKQSAKTSVKHQDQK